LLGLFFNHEGRGSTFLWSVGELSPDYTGVTTQRTVLFIGSSVRTTNPIHWWTFEDLHGSVE
jgi:hypothetical protein